MWKFLASTYAVAKYLWKFVKPVWADTTTAIKLVKEKGLKDDAARKQVFQYLTDCIHARGLAKVPDSVLNCTIELCYQIYLWRENKQK